LAQINHIVGCFDSPYVLGQAYFSRKVKKMFLFGHMSPPGALRGTK
jgi:hypothetical protein